MGGGQLDAWPIRLGAYDVFKSRPLFLCAQAVVVVVVVAVAGEGGR